MSEPILRQSDHDILIDLSSKMKCILKDFVSYDKYVALTEKMKAYMTDTEKRLMEMNNFREALREREAHFMTKEVFEARHKSLENKVEMLEDTIQSFEAQKKGLSMGWGILVAIIAGVSGVIALLLNAIRLYNAGL